MLVKDPIPSSMLGNLWVTWQLWTIFTFNFFVILVSVIRTWFWTASDLLIFTNNWYPTQCRTDFVLRKKNNQKKKPLCCPITCYVSDIILTSYSIDILCFHAPLALKHFEHPEAIINGLLVHSVQCLCMVTSNVIASTTINIHYTQINMTLL